MSKLLQVRPLTAEERADLTTLVRARTAPAALVQRATIVHLSASGLPAPVIAARLHVCGRTVRRWLYRFNDAGLPGLADRPRSGCPPTYTPAQRSLVVATALTNPQTLGLPFGSWTLDRLQAYLSAHQHLPMSRARIAVVLRDEGLAWRTQERWLAEQAQLSPAQAELDPEFAKKRGPSSNSTPTPRLSRR